MTEEQYITFQTAKLLKENGFDGECGRYYDPDGRLRMKGDICWNEAETPTQAVALRWLREDYRIAVMPIPYRYPGKWKNILVYLGEPMEKDDKYDICELDDTYTSYEQAAEAGIRHVVTHIVAKIRKELAKQGKQ